MQVLRSRSPWGAVLVAVVAAGALVAVACVPPPVPPPAPPPPPAPLPPPPEGILVVTDTYGGFDRPWELVFLPDGTALASERPGRLVRIVGGSRVVVAAVPGVHAAGEGGLMGMAVDPGFASNRRVYLCHASTAAGVPDVRIVRYRVAEDYSGIGEQTPLLTGIPAGVGDRHLGCRLGIGPDGMLWATTGDAVQPTAPQDPTDLAGKVLRMTLDGAPAPGNPGGAWHPLVYSIGHRNPQGLAFRPGDGAVFVAEHGTGCDDEVNRIVAGANYGWNPDGGGSYLEGAPMTFPGATPAVWASGCPTIAPSGATFVDGPGWRGWQGRLVMAVLKGQRLRFVAIDGSAVTAVDDRLTDQGRLRAVRLAPDGSLWVAQDRSPGAVMRLVPK